jgi:hypothetical protein
MLKLTIFHQIYTNIENVAYNAILFFAFFYEFRYCEESSKRNFYKGIW